MRPVDPSVSIDSRHRLVPEAGGWRVTRSDGRRSREVYGSQAAALVAVIREEVRWEHSAGHQDRRSAG